MDPGDEGRVDPGEFALHRLDDGCTRAGKLGEGRRQQVAGPSILHSVGDQSRVTGHHLPVDGIGSDDGIVRMGYLFGYPRLIFMDLELILVG